MTAITQFPSLGCYANPFEGVTVAGTVQKVWDVAAETIKTAVYLSLSPAFLAYRLIDDDEWGESAMTATWLKCCTAVRIGVFVETFLGGDESEVKARYLTVAAFMGALPFVEWMLDEGFNAEDCPWVSFIVHEGSIDVAKLLLERGAPLEPDTVKRMKEEDLKKLQGILRDSQNEQLRNLVNETLTKENSDDTN